MRKRKFDDPRKAKLAQTKKLMSRVAKRLFKPENFSHLTAEEQREFQMDVGRTLWQVFSNNHVVMQDSTAEDMEAGTWRFAGGLIADVLESVYGIHGLTYMDFYCSSSSGGSVMRAIVELRKMGYTVYDFYEIYEKPR